MKKELGIYIHIPFCKQKCYYCDFVSYPMGTEKMQTSMKINSIEDKNMKINVIEGKNMHNCKVTESIISKYIEAVKSELKKYDLSEYEITTIYIGGGTPSYIEPKYICELLEQILMVVRQAKLNSIVKENIELASEATDRVLETTEATDMPKVKINAEVTIEVNPGTVTKQKLETYKECGINRLSIGLQTTNNKLLKQIGRIHTYEEFLETYNLARSVGFKNINIDLIIGIPNQTMEDINLELKQILDLNPEHISVYSLIVEEGTPLEKMINKGKLELPNEDLERDMYWKVKNTLEKHGYVHYEISNFAKPGKESKHNCNCWKQKEYIGLGCVAHSYLNKTRYANTENLLRYIQYNIENSNNTEKNADNGNIKMSKRIEKACREVFEVQTTEDKQKEYMLLGLRMLEGVSMADFKEKFGQDLTKLFSNEIGKLTSEELIEMADDKIRLTRRGLDLANLVWEEFV